MRREHEDRPGEIVAAFEQAQPRRRSAEGDAVASQRDARADHRAAQEREVQPSFARITCGKVLTIGRTAGGDLYIRSSGRRVRDDLHTKQRRVKPRVDEFRPDDAGDAANVRDREIDHATAPVAECECAGLAGAAGSLPCVGRVGPALGCGRRPRWCRPRMRAAARRAMRRIIARSPLSLSIGRRARTTRARHPPSPPARARWSASRARRRPAAHTHRPRGPTTTSRSACRRRR